MEQLWLPILTSAVDIPAGRCAILGVWWKLCFMPWRALGSVVWNSLVVVARRMSVLLLTWEGESLGDRLLSRGRGCKARGYLLRWTHEHDKPVNLLCVCCCVQIAEALTAVHCHKIAGKPASNTQYVGDLL